MIEQKNTEQAVMAIARGNMDVVLGAQFGLDKTEHRGLFF